MICLDTNAVIAVINGRDPEVRVRLEAALETSEVLVVSVLVLYELWYGVTKSQRPQVNARILTEFLAAGLSICEFDAEDAREAGEIRTALSNAGTPIGPYDILIAAQARRRNARLVTANAREFLRVPGLRVEDWSH